MFHERLDGSLRTWGESTAAHSLARRGTKGPSPQLVGVDPTGQGDTGHRGVARSARDQVTGI